MKTVSITLTDDDFFIIQNFLNLYNQPPIENYIRSCIRQHFIHCPFIPESARLKVCSIHNYQCELKFCAMPKTTSCTACGA